MARVVLIGNLAQVTGGVAEFNLSATSVQQLFRQLAELHPALAPVKVAVLPLIPRSEDMSSKARALYEELRRAVVAEYDDSGQIGRRYRRQDEIGTPYALTIDEQTLEDDTVTIRDRDSLAQERIPIAGARALVLERLAGDWTTPKPD